MMNQKRGLTNKLSVDGDPWAPNSITENLEHQLNPGGPSNRQALRK